MGERPDSETEVTIPIKLFKIVGWVLSAVIAGAGGSVAIRSADPPAYDRFTGEDGDNLEREYKRADADLKGEMYRYVHDYMESEHKSMRADLRRLEGQSEQCRKTLAELPPKWLRDQVNECKQAVTEIKAEDRAIADKLNRLSVIERENASHIRSHDKEAEQWKRMILSNESSIKHLWEWINGGRRMDGGGE